MSFDPQLAGMRASHRGALASATSARQRALRCGGPFDRRRLAPRGRVCAPAFGRHRHLIRHRFSQADRLPLLLLLASGSSQGQ